VTSGSTDDADERHCSVFTIAKDDRVFFGGNDDYINFESYYWVEPGDSNNYGVIWIGERDNVQQGISETGLAYDANGLPRMDVNPHNERIPVNASYNDYQILIMQECATVEEVIEWVNTHQWRTFQHCQMQFADKTGDAVIISANEDGELVFTRKPEGDGFLVSTNFNVANPANGFGYPCWRYDRATEMLEQLVTGDEPLTLDDARNVLDAIHVERPSGWTKESMLADLSNGMIYLYLFYQFDKPLVINVQEELRNPRPEGDLSMLFPEDVRLEATRRYEEIQDMTRVCFKLKIAWIIIVLVGLLIFLVFSGPHLRKSGLWIFSFVILGPLALLTWLLVVLNKKSKFRKNTWQEVLGGLVTLVIASLVALAALLLVPQVQADPIIQGLLFFIFPAAFTWLVFHAPMLYARSDHNFPRFLVKRLPHAIVATMLGMAGIFAAAIPLINLSQQLCPLFPPSHHTIITLWFIVIMGGFVSAFLLYIFEYWNVRGGYLAWSALTDKESKVDTKSWRSLWWWVLISIAVLLLSLFAGVIINNNLS
jgi:hypothetical protein